MTNAELLRELRKPGKVFMPVLGKNDVSHIAVEKSDLIYLLAALDPTEKAEWTFYGTYMTGRKLDVQ